MENNINVDKIRIRWVDNINTPTEWMIKTLKIED
jgi:hypothetical protein